MAYLALYRKWRPQTFADVLGQAHICQALQNSLRLGLRFPRLPLLWATGHGQNHRGSPLGKRSGLCPRSYRYTVR